MCRVRVTDEPAPGFMRTCSWPTMLLHEMGLAHSVEVWMSGELIGGLYGVSLGKMFFGESMFSRASDASKIALVHLVRQLERWGFK